MPQSETKPERKPATDLLAPEKLAFKQKQPELKQRFPGEYVAIYKGRVAGHDLDEEALAARMYSELGDVAFYISHVEEISSILEIPSPEIVG